MPGESKATARLFRFLRVGRWSVSVQRLFETTTFDLVFRLFEGLTSKPASLPDMNIVAAVRWLFEFQELVRPYFWRLAEAVLSLVPEGDDRCGWMLFPVLRRGLEVASASDLRALISHPVYAHLEVFFNRKDNKRCYESVTLALGAHLDDAVCRAEMIRLFNRATNERILDAVICIRTCRQVAPYLPPDMIENMIERINATLAWKEDAKKHQEDYIFALGCVEILSELPGVDITRFEISPTRILNFVAKSRFPDAIDQIISFLTWYARFQKEEDIRALIEDCQERVMTDYTQIRAMVPAIIRLTLVAGQEWGMLWEYFSIWSRHSQLKVISDIMWPELAARMCPAIKQMILQMCGDEWWKSELASDSGQHCMKKAVEAMTEEEVLLAVGTIVGENDVLERAADRSLLRILCNQRPDQRRQIKEILADRRSDEDCYVHGEWAGIFEDDDEEEEDMM
jgi:hypothetical protein